MFYMTQIKQFFVQICLVVLYWCSIAKFMKEGLYMGYKSGKAERLPVIAEGWMYYGTHCPLNRNTKYTLLSC